MSEHQQRLEDLKKTSKKSMYFIGFVFLILILIYICNQTSKFPHGDRFGQFGDYIGGILNPLVAFMALLGLWKTSSIQTEMLKEQIEHEQKYKEQENLDLHEKKLNDMFKRDFDVYLNSVNTYIASKDVGLCNGKAAFYVLYEGQLFENIRKYLPLGETSRDQIHHNLIVEICTIRTIQFLGPVFRTMYQILKHQSERSNNKLIQESVYSNVSFFRTQLSREELIFIALNILYDPEGESLAIHVKKFGILKHLKNNFLRKEVISKYGPECFGRKFAQVYEEQGKISNQQGT